MANAPINKDADPIAKLMELVKSLRGKEGCPWDRKQTPQSMTAYLIEETFELLDAVVSQDAEHVREELGDVLFHVIFIARLYQENGRFDLNEVANAITEKMIRRHPHVFGDATADTSEDVKRQWQEIKAVEKAGAPSVSLLDTIPAHLPPLMRSYRISELAARVGFDWPDMDGVMEKVEEEWEELRGVLSEAKSDEGRAARVAEEFGDLLFTMVNVARFAGVHPESALTGAVRKFIGRFQYMEKKAAAMGGGIADLSFGTMNRLWEEAKKELKED